MTESEQSNERSRFRWPADYYTGPTPARVVPPWVTFGCGGLGVLALILIFAGGAFLSSGGFREVLDVAVGMSVSQMRGMYAGDVSAERKKTLEQEIDRLRENYRREKIAVPAMQPFLQTLSDATSDSRVTAAEAENLEQVAKRINAKVR